MKKSEEDRYGKVYHFDNFMPAPAKYGFVSLLQIGELQCGVGYEVREHPQICAEISYVVSGRGMFLVEDTEYPVEEGDIFLNRIGERHTIRSDPRENLRFLYLGFLLDEDAQGDRGLLSQFYGDPGKTRLTKDHSGLLSVFFNLLNEFYMGNTCQALAIESLLNEVLVLTYRNFKESSSKHFRPPKAADAAGNTVYSAIRYIESHAADLLEVREISRALGYSGSYLSHLFRERTGTTLQSYLSQKKVEAGIELMKSGRYSITQIAMRLGYDTLQSFCKAFRRVMQMPPTAYAKKLRESEEKSGSPNSATLPPEERVK